MNRRESLVHTGKLLAGTAALPGVLAVFFQRCNTIKESQGAWVPEFFDKSQADLVMSLVDAILPRTDTPGAVDALVHVFVDLYAKDCYTPEEQAVATKGLAELDTRSNEKYANDFALLVQNEREELLASLEAEGNQFIKMLKAATLLGYFSSMEGATKAADYNPVPGPFQGCVPAGEMKVSALS